MSRIAARGVLSVLTFSLVLSACDGTGDPSDITVNVAIVGTGTGSVEARTVGVDIDCNVVDGVISGSCSYAFQDSNGGRVRLEGQPDAVTNFSWGGDCSRTADRLCELEYGSGEDAVFDVVGRFDAKTVLVIVSPKPITMTTQGQEVIASAQAVDEDGAEVFGATFTWETSDASVATVTPLQNSRQATITALKNGTAIVSAMTQGRTGQTQVDVSITN